jgi:hypothetical protein
MMPQVPVWASWVEVPVKLFGLPLDMTTLSLWERFSKEGKVETIEIFESRTGQRNGGAKIRFCPPPKTAFWQGGVINMQHKGRVIQLRITLAEAERNFIVRSPSNPQIPLPEQIVSQGCP